MSQQCRGMCAGHTITLPSQFRGFGALEPSSTVLLALICRALVAAVTEKNPGVDLPPELMHHYRKQSEAASARSSSAR